MVQAEQILVEVLGVAARTRTLLATSHQGIGMRFSGPERTDLVINMTLAETFLLLLFVVWYGHTRIENPDPSAHLKERIASLEKDNERLKGELKQAHDRIADLKRRLDWWRDVFPGVDEFTSPGVARQQASRGHRKCDEQNNVLVHASVVRGQFSVEWLTENPKLSKWLADSGRPRPKSGARITDWSTIQALLAGVRDYYSSAKVNETECRFDYRLTYGSKEDYYDGRELFERYFYPAGLNRSSTGVQ